MKRIISILLCVLTISFVSFAGDEDALKQSIATIAKELVVKHPGSSRAKVAILQFRTNQNKVTPFSSYVQDQLLMNFQNTRFEVIDQNEINKIVDEYGWDLSKCTNFKVYSELSEIIFRKIGMVPSAFIYGQINDNDETITLTGYVVPNGLKSTNISSTQIFNSSAVTDKLLGKPVRQPKIEEPKVVVVEKPVVVEKQVIVEKQVVVEKPVYIEKPVYVEKEESKPVVEAKTEYAQKIGNLEFEMTDITFKGDRVEVGLRIVNNQSDDKINYIESRFIDDQGNEFKSSYVSNTFRHRELIEKVAIKGTITFDGDNIDKSQTMAVIEISVFDSTNSLMGTLRFRNVPIAK
ncbi:MAG: hypothetical protein AB7S48_07830 [Bacteroidales bacterium]